MIVNRDNETPMVIGIYGAWGAGKTTLMQTVKGIIDAEAFDDEALRRCKTVWFQAWKYAKEEEILAALVEEIFKTMQRDDFFSACKGVIEKLASSISIPKLSEKLIKVIGGGDIAGIFTEMAYKKKLGFYDTFQNFFDRLV